MKNKKNEPDPRSGLPAESGAQPLDARGFNPADYKWVPVLRRPRVDGWTAERQVRFIAALADGRTIAEAAKLVGMSETSCYRLRRSPGGERFAAAWDASRGNAAHRLVDMSFERAIDGTDEPVFDKEGRRVGSRRRYHDRMAMFLMRAYLPERFRDAHKGNRGAGDELPPPVQSLDEALRELEPVPPAEPHLLMSPDELEDEIGIANLCDGELPRFYGGERRDEGAGAAGAIGPDEEFERRLAAARPEPDFPPAGDDPGDADLD